MVNIYFIFPNTYTMFMKKYFSYIYLLIMISIKIFNINRERESEWEKECYLLQWKIAHSLSIARIVRLFLFEYLYLSARFVYIFTINKCIIACETWIFKVLFVLYNFFYWYTVWNVKKIVFFKINFIWK